jgi:TPR repeat protein
VRTMRAGITVIAVIVACGAAFVGFRFWQYERREPLREGISALKAGNHQLALTRLEPFARAGDPLAQRVLGEMYARGLGVPIDDARATMWFRRAECGCSLTGQNEYNLALNLADTADGAPAAIRWLQRAADAGNVDAQRLLADPSALKARGLTVETSVSDHWRRITGP